MAKLQHGTPGPKYDVSNITRFGTVKPAGAVMTSKPKVERVTFTPGPMYEVANVTRHGAVKPAGAVMVFKPKVQRATYTPGPAAYAVQHVIKNQPPMYSMGMQRPARKTPRPSPAPNAYALPSTIGNQASSAPVYSMSGRHGVTAANGTPGPARYDAADVTLTKAPQAPRPVLLGRRSGRRDLGGPTPAPNAYNPGPGGSRYAKAPEAFMAGRLGRNAAPYMAAADRPVNSSCGIYDGRGFTNDRKK